MKFEGDFRCATRLIILKNTTKGVFLAFRLLDRLEKKQTIYSVWSMDSLFTFDKRHISRFRNVNPNCSVPFNERTSPSNY